MVMVLWSKYCDKVGHRDTSSTENRGRAVGRGAGCGSQMSVMISVPCCLSLVSGFCCQFYLLIMIFQTVLF